RGHGHGQFAVRDFSTHSEARRVASVNGAQAYEYEVSKIRQHDSFHRCGARTPRTRAVNHPSLSCKAAEGSAYPSLVKPNCGGAGGGIRRIDSERDSATGEFTFGCDHTASVQEFIPTRDGSCYRIEVSDGEVSYCVRIQREGQG
ncbi:hypothetical protein OY671_012956, partial [Metschnikowia pulcherrima]